MKRLRELLSDLGVILYAVVFIFGIPLAIIGMLVMVPIAGLESLVRSRLGLKEIPLQYLTPQETKRRINRGLYVSFFVGLVTVVIVVIVASILLPSGPAFPVSK